MKYVRQKEWLLLLCDKKYHLYRMKELLDAFGVSENVQEEFMRDKKIIIILSVLLILIFAASAVSASLHQDTQQTVSNSGETDDGCCSVVCQLDGNNSIISFRRDANYSADVSIEKINWHICQFKILYISSEIASLL